MRKIMFEYSYFLKIDVQHAKRSSRKVRKYFMGYQPIELEDVKDIFGKPGLTLTGETQKEERTPKAKTKANLKGKTETKQELDLFMKHVQFYRCIILEELDQFDDAMCLAAMLKNPNL